MISAGIVSFCIKAAEEFNTPQVQFWSASACSFMGYLHLSELARRGIISFKRVFSLLFLLQLFSTIQDGMRYAPSTSLLSKDKIHPFIVSEESFYSRWRYTY
jgi:hypothetical protein